MKKFLFAFLFGFAAACISAVAQQPAAAATKGAADLFGEKLVNAQGSEVSASSLSNKTVGVYFSAHWCPPCRAFTPVLVDFYNKLKADKKAFEVVFVSFDNDKQAMAEYMKALKMPWLAVPYDSPKAAELKTKFGVRGIPTLVVLRPDGTTVTADGRADVQRDGASAFDKWK